MKTELIVKVYSTPTCHWCGKVKEFLKANKIKFTEIDVSKDAKAREYIIKKSGQMGVPVTEINGVRFIVGFDEYEFRDALNLP